jgi:hypothetical protein
LTFAPVTAKLGVAVDVVRRRGVEPMGQAIPGGGGAVRRRVRRGRTFVLALAAAWVAGCGEPRGTTGGPATTPRPGGEVAPPADGSGAGAAADVGTDAGPAAGDGTADAIPGDPEAGPPPASWLSPGSRSDEQVLAAFHDWLVREAPTGRCGPAIGEDDPAWSALLAALSGVVGLTFSPELYGYSFARVIPVELTGDGDLEVVVALWFDDRGPEGTGNPAEYSDQNSCYWLSVLRWTAQGYVAGPKECVGSFFFIDDCDRWDWRDLDGDGTLEALAQGSESHSDGGGEGSIYAFGVYAGVPAWLGAILVHTGGSSSEVSEVEGTWRQRADGPGLEYVQVMAWCEEDCPDHEQIACENREQRWLLVDGCLQGDNNYWRRCSPP